MKGTGDEGRRDEKKEGDDRKKGEGRGVREFVLCFGKKKVGAYTPWYNVAIMHILCCASLCDPMKNSADGAGEHRQTARSTFGTFGNVHGFCDVKRQRDVASKLDALPFLGCRRNHEIECPVQRIIPVNSYQYGDNSGND